MVELPPGYIDPDITGQDRALLEAFYIGVYSEGGTADEVNLRGIRAALAAAQPAPPAPVPEPVPVSERPWEREGWCDEQGRCWLCGKVERDWRLLDPENSGVPQIKYCFSHSLPASALPLPTTEATE